jgi:small subunit ribosomal protein S8
VNTTDPVADYLTRLRNAIQARHKRVEVPASNLKRAITKILLEQNYISSYSEIEDNKQGILKIVLRYTEGRSAISGLKRISKPGLRVYIPSDELPRVLNGLGIAIVSSSKGIVTEKQARQLNVGGEILCHIW